MKYRYLAILFVVIFSVNILAQTHNALSYDGISGQYVRVPHTDTLAPTTAITVEAWIINSTSTGGPSFISKTELGGYAFYKASSTIKFDIRLNGSYHTVSYDGAGLSAGWHHVAATCDGQYTRLYVDGDLKNTNNAGAVYEIQYLYQNSLIIGAEASSSLNSSGDYFTGSIDEVRIWNISRTVSEINSSMNTSLVGNESGLIGYWNFDEGTGNSANDLSQYNHDGTLVGSPTWISSSALPVELTSFTAAATLTTVELLWNTATETNNYGFDIERRTPSPALPLQGEGLSGGQWTKIGFVEGNGTTNAPKKYVFTDQHLSVGKHSYRLKQIDRDGKFEYSKEIEVVISQIPQMIALMQNYPNPFNPSTKISFAVPTSQRAVVRVFNILSKEVATLFNGIAEANRINTLEFNGKGLASGIYFYSLKTGNKYEVKKMLMTK